MIFSDELLSFLTQTAQQWRADLLPQRRSERKISNTESHSTIPDIGVISNGTHDNGNDDNYTIILWILLPLSMVICCFLAYKNDSCRSWCLDIVVFTCNMCWSCRDHIEDMTINFKNITSEISKSEEKLFKQKLENAQQQWSEARNSNMKQKLKILFNFAFLIFFDISDYKAEIAVAFVYEIMIVVYDVFLAFSNELVTIIYIYIFFLRVYVDIQI